jgi:hypothetical protein
MEIGVTDNGQPLVKITKCDYPWEEGGRILCVRNIIVNTNRVSINLFSSL